MSQAAIFGSPRIGPSAPSVIYPQIDDSLDALLSQNSGSSAPSYAVEGTFWADTSTAGFVTLKMYDGADWTSVLVLDKTANAIRMVDINPEVQIASGSTVAIGGVASETVEVTGTTTITSFGTSPAGTLRRMRFSSSLVITHNATSLICPTGASITTGVNDSCVAMSLGSGNWRILTYTPASTASGLVLISTKTASASANLDFTTEIDAQFETYMLSIVDFAPSTDDTVLRMQVGTGGSPTWQTSGYTFSAQKFAPAGITGWGSSISGAGSGVTGYIPLSVPNGTEGVGNASGETLAAEVTFTRPTATKFPRFRFQSGYERYDNLDIGFVGVGSYRTSTAITGIRLSFTSGNIASGVARLYGLRK